MKQKIFDKEFVILIFITMVLFPLWLLYPFIRQQKIKEDLK